MGHAQILFHGASDQAFQNNHPYKIARPESLDANSPQAPLPEAVWAFWGISLMPLLLFVCPWPDLPSSQGPCSKEKGCVLSLEMETLIPLSYGEGVRIFPTVQEVARAFPFCQVTFLSCKRMRNCWKTVGFIA